MSIDLNIVGVEDVDFESADFIINPYPIYEKMQRDTPVYKGDDNVWRVFRSADIQRVLTGEEFGHAQDIVLSMIHGENALESPVIANILRMMQFKNGAEHRRVRSVLAKTFTSRMVRELKPAIQKHIDELIEKAKKKGRMELMADFARPLPLLVICDLLGVPGKDQHKFLDKRFVSERVMTPPAISEIELVEENKVFDEFYTYFKDLIEEKKCNPGRDMISIALSDLDINDGVTIDELISNILLIFDAGHKTSTNLIGNAVYALLDNPAQRRLLLSNAHLVSGVVNETLRFDSPSQITGRLTFQDVELSGVTIPGGQYVVAVLGAANRDPEIYDNPHHFDISRPINRSNLVFGSGPHMCLGIQLAMAEGELAIGSLFKEFPDLAIDLKEGYTRSPNIIIRGFNTLHLTC